MEQLKEELTCPICCGLFEDPRVLLCSHSFCKKCLEGLLEGNRGPIFRAPIKCPTCRKESPHNGANSLQINYSLRGIVEKFKEIKVMPNMSVCKQHSDQPLNMFCATDSRLICGFCATTVEHSGHRFRSLEDGYAQEKDAFEKLLHGVKSWQSADILSCLETLQTSKKRALQSVSKDAEKVSDYFDKLISSLECKKNEILSDFETLKLVVMQAYDPEITALSAALEEQKQAISMAESFRGVSDPLDFLQQMQEFREKFKLLQDTSIPPEKNRDVCPHVRNFDVKKWDSLRLGDVDKMSVPHESGSYRTGDTRTTRNRWRVLVLSLVLVLPVLVFLLLSPHTAHVTSQFEASLCGLSQYVSHSALHLQGMTDMKHARTCHLLRSA
uniref:Tripartite motif containing 13 n=1 Tax=Gouania willdenowi TaxID=441366 RepID=A0A8C5GF69_GOUWI